MKLHLFTFIMGILIGMYVYKAALPEMKPEVQIKEVVRTNTKVVRVTKPSGEVVETTTTSSKTDIRPEPLKKPNYGIGLYHDKTIFGEIRLGQLPLFFIAETDFKEGRIGIKLEF